MFQVDSLLMYMFLIWDIFMSYVVFIGSQKWDRGCKQTKKGAEQIAAYQTILLLKKQRV